MLHLLSLYLMIGIAVATVDLIFTIHRAWRTGFQPSDLLRTIAAVPLWPIFAPILLIQIAWLWIVVFIVTADYVVDLAESAYGMIKARQ